LFSVYKTYLITSLIFLSLILNPLQILHADIIELSGNKKIYGQLISIKGEIVFVETLSKANASTQLISLPRKKVIKVTDESGTVLFSDNTQHIHVLKRYYEEIYSNWEELNDSFRASIDDTVTFKNGQGKRGKIINISKQFLFMQKGVKDTLDQKVVVEKFKLKTIKSIGKTRVQFIDPLKSRPKISRKIKYPLYSVSGGVVYAQTNYDQLQKLFQEFYDKSGISYSAEKRLANYLGLQAKFEIFIKPYLSFGFSGFFYNTKKINALGMTRADLKYTLYQSPWRPWLSAGFSGYDYSSTEKVGQNKYIWDTSKGTTSFGIGLDIGDELGSGYVFSVHYLPLGNGTTKIKGSDIGVKKKLDFSIIIISLGMRFNFN
jgi:hypothetical protein